MEVWRREEKSSRRLTPVKARPPIGPLAEGWRLCVLFFFSCYFFRSTLGWVLGSLYFSVCVAVQLGQLARTRRGVLGIECVLNVV